MKVLQRIFTVLLLVSLLVSPLSFTACQTSTPPPPNFPCVTMIFRLNLNRFTL